jgi:predicted PurR-regulated permease PerM
MDDDRFYARLFAVALLAAIGAAVIALLRPFATPICWALLFAFVLHPANVWLRRRFHDGRGLAASVLTIAVLLGIAAPAAWIIVAFVTQAAELVKRLSEASAGGGLRQLPMLQRVSDWLASHFSISTERILEFVNKNVSALLRVSLSQGEVILASILGTGAAIALMLLVLFFALRGGDQAANRLIEILPLGKDHKSSLVDHMSAVTRATVLGALVVGLVQGLLVGFSFLVAGLPSPVVFGVLASIASLLPVGGTALVWGPAAIVLVAQGRWGAALFVSLWGLVVVSLSDNLIRPRFISGRAQVPALGVLLGVFGGVPLFGLLGVFAGPIIIALALALLRFAEEKKPPQ